MNKKVRYVIVPNLVQVTSNVSCIPHFSFGDHLYDCPSSEPVKVNVIFNVANNIDLNSKLNQRFNFYYGHEGINEIYYERPLLVGKIKLMLKDLHTLPKLFVNGFYHRYMRFPLGTIFPPGIHFTDIILVKLLELGYMATYSACVSCEEEAVLIFAPPEVGKTLTALSALNFGFSFLSEDITITDGEYAYSVPLTSTYEESGLPNDYKSQDKPRTLLQEIIKRVYSGPTNVLSYFRPKSPNLLEILSRSKVEQKAKIKTICILDQGKTCIGKLDKREVFRRTLLSDRYEFSYYRNPLLLVYSYFNETLDLNKLMEKEESLLLDIIDRSDCYVLRAFNPAQYSKLLEKVISR